VVFCEFSQGNEMTEPRMTTEELRVVEVLFEDWKNLLRRTAHQSGMERVGGPFSHVRRLRLAEFALRDTAAGSDALGAFHLSVDQ
jgi:hypothetical protein